MIEKNTKICLGKEKKLVLYTMGNLKRNVTLIIASSLKNSKCQFIGGYGLYE
ncbi:hypothetical protein BN174_4370009 [Clostridioides difficile E15]|nr:hypothetical protein BN174_4370009 [Clostridioides difficile E15]